MWSHLLIAGFHSWPNESYLKSLFLHLYRYCLCFFFSSFGVSGFTLRSLIHLELFFCRVKDIDLILLITHEHLVSTVYLLNKMSLFQCVLGFFAKYQMAVVTCTQLRVFYFVPLVYMSVFEPVPYCFYYFVSVIYPELCKDNLSSIIIFTFDCSGHPKSFVLPCEFQYSIFFHVYIRIRWKI